MNLLCKFCAREGARHRLVAPPPRRAAPLASDPVPQNPSPRHRAGSLTLHIGHAELVVRQRYEAASVANDALTAACFLIGSIMFFS
ncbi:YrhK family protein, partial [Streptomyces sp. PU-14G]|uniref:YrhK family protein n=1 Tax=Streptomyces sp. PU-14G TaxID=2800808 RepID=UPI0034DEFE07